MLDQVLSQLTSVNLIKDVAVPGAAAFGAMWVALRKFKRERLWQEKYVAYRKVLEAVEAIRYWADEVTSNVHCMPSVGDFDGKTSGEFYAAAQRELVKQDVVGSLLLTAGFAAKLTEFNTELYRERFTESEEFYGDDRDAHFGYGQHAQRIRSIADAYLPQLIELARKDLGA